MTEFWEILKKDRVISLKDASKILGNKMAVYRLEQKKMIRKVHPDGLGYFSLPETEEGEAQFAIVAKYYPQCVVSGPTALSLYGLSQDYISEIDVDIPRTTNLSNDLLNVHRVLESKINNVVFRSFESRGVPFEIKIYSPERALHEAYKYYKGLDSFYYAIKKYRLFFLNLVTPGDQYGEILEINKTSGPEILSFLKMEDSDG
jgi:hypothetical protein